MIIETLQASLAGMFSISGLFYLTLGVVFGLIIGILPGLGGMFALSMLLPFLLELAPYNSLALLIGTYAATPAGGAITAILLGVPGTVSSAATVLEGFPMAKKGLAGEAIGAALTASAIGGVTGAAVLLLMTPILRQIVLLFGPSEMVMLTLLGVSFVGMLGGEGGVTKSWISGCFGLLLATVGLDMVTGKERFTFGMTELWDGLPLIAVVLGLFALAEMMELSKNQADYHTEKKLNFGVVRGMLKGAGFAIANFYLILRCSIIGVVIGMIPGIGGETAIFLAYGHAAQTSKNSQKFGQGAIEGVIAPEAANNAKEGGALIPTIGLGVPGSALMAIFLGAFMLMGLYPGPGMLLKSMDIVLVIIWALMLGSVIASLIAFLFGVPMVKLVYRLKNSWLAVSVVALSTFGVYVSRSLFIDLVVLFSVCILGIFMKFYNFPRASLLVGFVLGGLLEKNTQQAYSIFGWKFFLQPLSMVILAIIIAGMVIPKIIKRHQKKSLPPKKGERKYSCVCICLFGLFGLYSLSFGIPSAIAPFIASLVGFISSIVYFMNASWVSESLQKLKEKFDFVLIFFVFIFIVLTYLFGFYFPAIFFMISFLYFIKKEKATDSLLVAMTTISMLYFIGYFFDVEIPEGIFLSWI